MGKWTLYSLTALTLCLCLLVAPLMAADATKAQGQLMDWTLLDDTAGTPFVESAVLDAGEGYDAAITTVLHVTMCHCSADAAGDYAGFKVFVRISADEEGWREFVNLRASGGTSNVGDMDDTAASAQAVIPLTATTNFETPGDVFFLHDAGTMADSCLVIFGGTYDNDVSITVIDNLVNAYDASDNLYDIVDQWTISIPGECDEAKVLFYNTDADCNYACRIDYSHRTDIE